MSRTTYALLLGICPFMKSGHSVTSTFSSSAVDVNQIWPVKVPGIPLMIGKIKIIRKKD